MTGVDVLEATLDQMQVIQSVEEGQTIPVMHDGKIIGEFVPAPRSKRSVQEVLESIKRFREQTLPDDMSVLELIEESRRH